MPNLIDYQMNNVRNKPMRKTIFLILSISFVLTLFGCAPHPAKAPCSDYGRWCQKIPVNSWDDQT